ncbi:MAG: hypothetical protein WC949_04465 [Candidatus Paceibacterota bacterium]|jgi:hypothetical protein
MNPKLKTIIVLLFVASLAVGGYWLAKNNNKPSGSSGGDSNNSGQANEQIIQSGAEDYNIQESAVVNEKGGITYSVPQDWKAGTIGYENQGSVFFYSPNVPAERDANGAPKMPLQTGCLIESTVVYKNYSTDDIRKEIAPVPDENGDETNNIQEITVQGIQALKQFFPSQAIGDSTLVYLPKNGKVYTFAVYLPLNEEEKSPCTESFNKFLEAISIK